MQNIKKKFSNINKAHLLIVGVLFLILLAVCLLWFNNSTSLQAGAPMVAKVSFDGKYRIGDGEWQDISEGEHIPATKGDVTLKGNFHMWAPDGQYVSIYRGDVPIAFYVNHINLTIYEGENEPFVVDIEDSRYGDSVCGVTWTAYTFMSDPDETIEILIHNPHIYGNETAIDEMLSKLAFWSGIEFEKGVLDSGSTERSIGLVLALVSIMLLGIALFSSLIHVRNSKTIWLLGSLILFAGIYFAYNADGVSFWSESFVSNTTILGASMMLYMFLLSIFIVCFMTSMQGIGALTVVFLGVANAVIFFLPIVSDILFYDLFPWWISAQIIANAVLAICLIREFLTSKTRLKWFFLGALLPLSSFAVDVLGVYFGFLKGGVISQYVFTILFVVAIIMVLKLIPNKINEATKAQELEMERIVLNAELAKTRISTMMSQIRPHFIYNTLGSIEQLCDLDPKKAGELVHDFAKYLRGNFGELDNPNPILMSQEMDHVHHYLSIENVRFPDMTFTFEMNSDDFRIPALTIQPIVENAIKHGLMKLQKGGTIHVVSYETDTDYCVSVEDDGVGFDTSLWLEDRAHVGLRNIRERLKSMVNGTIEIDSTVGVGTKVLIKIPKE